MSQQEKTYSEGTMYVWINSNSYKQRRKHARPSSSIIIKLVSNQNPFFASVGDLSMSFVIFHMLRSPAEATVIFFLWAPEWPKTLFNCIVDARAAASVHYWLRIHRFPIATDCKLYEWLPGYKCKHNCIHVLSMWFHLQWTLLVYWTVLILIYPAGLFANCHQPR